MAFNLTGKRIWIAGHTGMVGSALCRALKEKDFEILSVSRAGLDLRDQAATYDWIAKNKPDGIIMAAATVGGIGANMAQPAAFFHDNMAMANNVIHGAYLAGVQKLLYLGSSCIYPREAPQPFTPNSLMSGPLEPSNAPYALAKLGGIQLCQSYSAQYGCDFISALPCNLYGAGDRYDEADSHVIPALIMKAQAAKKAGTALNIWGDGSPLREFLYVDDLASALILLLEQYSGAAPVNIGSGKEISIKDLAHLITQITGFEGEITHDKNKPNGTPRKLMDSAPMRALGWAPATSLEEGLKRAYQDYLERYEH